MTDYRRFIMDVYAWALKEHLVYSEKEFAAQLGVRRSTMSSLLSGNYKGGGKVIAGKAATWKKAAELGALEETPEEEPASPWQDYRKEVAKDVMCSMLSSCALYDKYPNPDEIAEMSILYTDRLIGLFKAKGTI